MSVSSSSWCLGRAASCDCGTPWSFLLPSLIKPNTPKLVKSSLGGVDTDPENLCALDRTIRQVYVILEEAEKIAAPKDKKLRNVADGWTPEIKEETVEAKKVSFHTLKEAGRANDPTIQAIMNKYFGFILVNLGTGFVWSM